jgi:hypothetical protein
MSDDAGVFCELCKAAAVTIAAVIPPLGSTIGKRIFFCQPCDHYTFIDWLGSYQQGSTKPEE